MADNTDSTEPGILGNTINGVTKLFTGEQPTSGEFLMTVMVAGAAGFGGGSYYAQKKIERADGPTSAEFTMGVL